MHPETWLKPTPAGLLVEPGGFYIDPSRAVDRAVITHGHSDHARGGHRHVLATPETLAIMRSRIGPEPVGAFASGWMQIRARARQRGVELPLVISDHADWDELTATIAELRPGELWITHGREEALARWASLNGIPARALALVGYEDDDD